MANHVRQQLREAVAALLTGLPTTGARVYIGRVHTLVPAELPCLLISTPDEPIVETLGVRQPTIYRRDLELNVVLMTRTGADLEAALDAIAKEVEIALGAGLTLSGNRFYPRLLRMSSILERDGDLPKGSMTLSYNIAYHTASNQPDVVKPVVATS